MKKKEGRKKLISTVNCSVQSSLCVTFGWCNDAEDGIKSCFIVTRMHKSTFIYLTKMVYI